MNQPSREEFFRFEEKVYDAAGSVRGLALRGFHPLVGKCHVKDRPQFPYSHLPYAIERASRSRLLTDSLPAEALSTLRKN